MTQETRVPNALDHVASNVWQALGDGGGGGLLPAGFLQPGVAVGIPVDAAAAPAAADPSAHPTYPTYPAPHQASGVEQHAALAAATANPDADADFALAVSLQAEYEAEVSKP